MKIEETVCGASALDQLECVFLLRLWLDAKLSFAWCVETCLSFSRQTASKKKRKKSKSRSNKHESLSTHPNSIKSSSFYHFLNVQAMFLFYFRDWFNTKYTYSFICLFVHRREEADRCWYFILRNHRSETSWEILCKNIDALNFIYFFCILYCDSQVVCHAVILNGMNGFIFLLMYQN